jgi:hypothetical protein
MIGTPVGEDSEDEQRTSSSIDAAYHPDGFGGGNTPGCKELFPDGLWQH